MDKVKEMMTEMLKNEKDSCQITIQELMADDRKDEANLEKVRLNVYDIFETMLGAMEKKVMSNRLMSEEEKVQEFYKAYISSLDNIPNSWREKLGKAKERDMIEDVVIEELKLETVKIIRDYFVLLYEEN